MSDIVQLVAKGIYEASKHNIPYRFLTAFQREKYEREARAAIENMRDPTDAMGDAAQAIPDGIGGCPPHWKNIWTAMIDEALK